MERKTWTLAMVSSWTLARRVVAYLSVAAADRCAVPPALGSGTLILRGPCAANGTAELDAAPCAPRAAWLATMRAWRRGCRAQLRLSPAIYEEPKMRWARTAYFQPLMMVRCCQYWLLCAAGGGGGAFKVVLISHWCCCSSCC